MRSQGVGGGQEGGRGKGVMESRSGGLHLDLHR